MTPTVPEPAEAEDAQGTENQREEASEGEQVYATEQVTDVDFMVLFTGYGFRIALTECRAISIDQLDLILAHTTRRLTCHRQGAKSGR